MVGYEPWKKGRPLTPMENAIAGAFSGTLTRAATQPLDVLKIRFQLQVEPINRCTGGKYRSIMQAVRNILKEESVGALWKGHVPGQALSMLYGMIQFGTFDSLSHFLNRNFVEEGKENVWSPVVNFGCGSMCGALATTITLPLDVLRTRLVAQGEPQIYTGMRHAVSCMLREEGVSSLYKGLFPALISIVPYAGIQFFSYSLLCQLYNSFTESYHKSTTAQQSLLCGTLSGIIAKAVTFPFDVTKKRLQICGFERARLRFGKVQTYNSFSHCLFTIIKQEGCIGIFKGISPGLLKAGVSSGLIFLTYERCAAFIRTYN